MDFMTLHHNVRLRLGVGFVQRFFDIMLAPLMVIHFAVLYGAATAGLMTVVTAGSAMACTFLGGHLADVHGRRPVLLIGECGTFVAYAGMAVSNSPLLHSGVATYLCYLAATSLAGIALPANDAMIIDVSTPATRTTVYTVNYWAINLAFMLGSLVGAFLYNGHFFDLLLAGVVCTLAIFTVTWFAITETAPPESAGNARSVSALLSGYVLVARDTVFLRLILAALLVRSIEVQITSYIAVRLGGHFPTQRLISFGAWQLTVNGVNMLGILRAANTVLVLCFALLAKKMFGKYSEQRRLDAGIVLFTVGYLVWTVSDNAWVLIAAAVVLTAGEIMNAPVKQSLLANLVPAKARTKYMAVYGLTIKAGLLVGSLCVTLGAVVSPAVMAGLFGLFGLGAFVIYRSLFRADAARTLEVEARALVSPAPDPDPVQRSGSAS